MNTIKIFILLLTGLIFNSCCVIPSFVEKKALTTNVILHPYLIQTLNWHYSKLVGTLKEWISSNYFMQIPLLILMSVNGKSLMEINLVRFVVWKSLKTINGKK